MNRKQKIIVSVTGIFLIALILMGLTYAYFLTQIKGNTNSTSISVTTANLKLVYEDNSAELIDNKGVKIQPVSELNTNNRLGTKKFTITNEGDDTEYVILIEDVRVKDATTGKFTAFNTNDFVYDLKCVEVSNPLEYILKDEKKVFPLRDSIISEPLRINQGKIHSCDIDLWYKDNGLNQSADMNKTLEAKINIEDPNRMNPYSDDTSSLAYNIINNAMSTTSGGSKFMINPPSKVAEEASLSDYPQGVEGPLYAENLSEVFYYGTKEALESCNPFLGDCSDKGVNEYSRCNEDVIGKYLMYGGSIIGDKEVTGCKNRAPVVGSGKYESILSVTEDDEGRSYYYRGNVEDNYVNFNNMCWRIVRIEGDGAIKLVLEDVYDKCDEITDTDGDGHTFYADWFMEGLNYVVPYSDYNTNAYDYAQMKNILLSWYNNNISDTNKSKIKTNTTWCLGDISNIYNAQTGALIGSREELLDSDQEYIYDSGKRIMGVGSNPNVTLLCEKNNYSKDESAIGTLTADEVIFAGASYDNINQNFYLANKTRPSDILLMSIAKRKMDESFFTMADTIFTLNMGQLYHNSFVMPSAEAFVRPSLSLNSGTQISDGIGTQTNPYEIK